MRNPCKPDCEGRTMYCHSHCDNYKEWKSQYRNRDQEEQEYMEYVTSAIDRMKGENRWG